MAIKRTPLESAGIAFVNAREKKARLKKERAEQLKKCVGKVWYRLDTNEHVSHDELNEWDHLYLGENTMFQLHETCVYKHPKNHEKLCASCRKSNELHVAFRDTSRTLISARKSLISAVHRATDRKKKKQAS